MQADEIEEVITKFPCLKSELKDVFCSEELGIKWLTSHIPALGGLTPVEVVQKGDLKLVLMTLNKIKDGDYS
ncbi:MbcA/ParS/Xre antitoxin family protein [Vibrio sp. YIC-376]|uniref:MbcA/ParS/Xre antitoxin family protein n=1 Tax=Vibrio sp. YIC-376 TaxID=3136162 RepID=UPI00402A6C6C